MKYILVRNIDDGSAPRGFLVENFTDDNLFPAMEVRGFEPTGAVDANRYSDGKARSIPLRPELDGAPIFAGLCGPMWDGDKVRYEDRYTNDYLSI